MSEDQQRDKYRTRLSYELNGGVYRAAEPFVQLAKLEYVGPLRPMLPFGVPFTETGLVGHCHSPNGPPPALAQPMRPALFGSERSGSVQLGV